MNITQSFYVECVSGADNQVVARVVGLPDTEVTAPSRDEAVGRVRELLQSKLDSGHIVPVELQSDRIIRWFGHAKDDPDKEAYLEEIRRNREGTNGAD